jgi:hypothetical protein
VKSLIGAGLLILLSLFMLFGFMRSTATLSSFGTVMALLITVVLPGAAGIALAARRFRHGRLGESRRDQLRRQTIEAEVLRLAGERGGRLTLVEIVTEMAVSSEAAQGALDALVQREIADIAVTDSGVLVYTFHDVERIGEKARARGILE